jgi:hypothetical protein
VGQLEDHIQCLGVGQLEDHIQCLGVGQLEDHIQCLVGGSAIASYTVSRSGSAGASHTVSRSGSAIASHTVSRGGSAGASHTVSRGGSLIIFHTQCFVSPPDLFPTEFEVHCSQHVVLCFAGKNPLAKQHVVVCYVAEWARNRRGRGGFTVDNIDPTVCTHLVYAFAHLDTTRNAIEPRAPDYDLEENNGTGWCIVSTVWIAVCANLSQVQEVQ